jgi:hypothetical protein
MTRSLLAGAAMALAACSSEPDSESGEPRVRPEFTPPTSSGDSPAVPAKPTPAEPPATSSCSPDPPPLASYPVGDSCFPEGVGMAATYCDGVKTAEGWRFACLGDARRPNLNGCRALDTEQRGTETVTLLLCPAAACTRFADRDGVCGAPSGSRPNAFACPPEQVGTLPTQGNCLEVEELSPSVSLRMFCCP